MAQWVGWGACSRKHGTIVAQESRVSSRYAALGASFRLFLSVDNFVEARQRVVVIFTSQTNGSRVLHCMAWNPGHREVVFV